MSITEYLDSLSIVELRKVMEADVDEVKTPISSKRAFYIMKWCPYTDSGYSCPVCGQDANDAMTLIWWSSSRYYPSYDCSHAYEWDELHKCDACGSYYQLTDSNC